MGLNYSNQNFRIKTFHSLEPVKLQLNFQSSIRLQSSNRNNYFLTYCILLKTISESFDGFSITYTTYLNKIDDDRNIVKTCSYFKIP